MRAIEFTELDDFDDRSIERPDLAASRALLERALKAAGTPAALARQLAISPSHVCRLAKGFAGPGIELLLRLADVLAEDPIGVLRVCGRPALAERLDLMRRYPGPAPVAALFTEITRLSDSDRRLVTELIARLRVDSIPAALPTPDPPSRSRR
jgi:hypothetical protein